MVEIRYDELEQLVDAHGPPNAEDQVAETFERLIKPHVDNIEWDAVGNVVATSEGDPDETEFMLAAHTDELGFLINQIREDGLLEFTLLGGHYKGNLAGQRVQVGPDGVLGVIGAKSRHNMSDKEHESLPTDLCIDIGADSPEEVGSLNVEAGDYATWEQDVDQLNNDRVTGRALDDRIALTMLLAVAREADYKGTIHYVATTQEEVGLRGARAAGYSINPDVAIALEIFPADDYPAGGNEGRVHIGEGPVVEFGDGTSEYMFGGILVDRQTLTWLKRASERAEVPLQHAVMIRGTTDATEFQGVRGGRHAGAVAIPCRYTHSPVETVSLTDANNAVDLLITAFGIQFPDRDETRI